ncbi:MAG: hypothetical protein WAL97_00015 [Halobacteriota archaeon]
MVLVDTGAVAKRGGMGLRDFSEQAYIFIARDEIDCNMGNFCTNGGKMRLLRPTNSTLCREAAEPSDVRAEDSLPSSAADLNLRSPEQ